MYSPKGKLDTPKDFNFPFVPYDIQQQLMETVYNIIEEKKIGIIESPTGTGKSLTLTCASLRWLLDHKLLVKKEIRGRIEFLQKTITDCNTVGNCSDNWIKNHSSLLNHKKELNELQILEDYVLQEDNLFSVLKRQKMDTKIINDKVDEANANKIDVKKNVIGSEKTQQKVQIFFCSRTHSQISQIVGEIKRTVYGKSISCVTLASRKHLCINPDLTKSNNISLINENCLALLRKELNCKKSTNASGSTIKIKSGCPFRVHENVTSLGSELLLEITDIEDTVTKSKSKKTCPYYASKYASNFADIILLPYQMVLHRKTREKAGINLNGNILIIDEAHNLLDSIIQMNSSAIHLSDLSVLSKYITIYKKTYLEIISAPKLLMLNQLLYIIKQLKKILLQPPIRNLLKTYEISEMGDFFNIDLTKIVTFCEETRLSQKLQNVLEKDVKSSEKHDCHNPQMQSFLQNMNSMPLSTDKNWCKGIVEDEYQNGSGSKLRNLLKFLECLCDDADYGRVLVSSVDENNKFLKYILLNAGEHFNDIISEARAIIIAGGTMRPTNELTEQLLKSYEYKVKEYFFGHVIPKKAVLPIIVNKGPADVRLSFTYTNRNCSNMINELGSILLKLCKIVPAGLVCFFPSYEYLEAVYKVFEKDNILDALREHKEILREFKLGGRSTEQLLNCYAKAVKNRGALLLSVVGGNLSEGLNFADDLGRGIIVVGLPYPNRHSIEITERMKYLDTLIGKGAGNEFYENACMKLVNQCIGRSVRHINDYACVFLLDERFTSMKIQSKLPEWIKCSLETYEDFNLLELATNYFFSTKV